MNKPPPDTAIVGTDFVVEDFWSWAYSDILSNRNRGIFAEFLVGSSLGVLDEPRIEWDGHDLIYSDLKIEVKSSSYLQSWHQTELSTIRFDIAPKTAWDSKTNTFNNSIKRHSDYYVFCLFESHDKATASILDVEQWKFFVIPTETLNQHFPKQKSIGIKSLKKLSNTIGYHQIKPTIDRLLKS